MAVPAREHWGLSKHPSSWPPRGTCCQGPTAPTKHYPTAHSNENYILALPTLQLTHVPNTKRSPHLHNGYKPVMWAFEELRINTIKCKQLSFHAPLKSCSHIASYFICIVVHSKFIHYLSIIILSTGRQEVLNEVVSLQVPQRFRSSLHTTVTDKCSDHRSRGEKRSVQAWFAACCYRGSAPSTHRNETASSLYSISVYESFKETLYFQTVRETCTHQKKSQRGLDLGDRNSMLQSDAVWRIFTQIRVSMEGHNT